MRLDATRVGTLVSCLLVLSSATSWAQGVAGLVCKPVSQRSQQIGCWIMADDPIGKLRVSPVYWHLDVYPARAAADADKGPRSTIVESLGQVWLMTIDEEKWRSAHGTRIA